MAKKLTKNEKYIVEQYVRYFGKAPTDAQIADYADLGKPKLILAQIRGEADDAKPSDIPYNDYIDSIFQNLFGRPASGPEKTKYAKTYDKKGVLPINAIVKAAKPSDKAVYDNKMAVAVKYAELGGTEPLDLSKISKGNLIELNFLNTVTKSADLKAKVDDLPENSGVPTSFDGKTFTLTTDVDTFNKGTAKNDLFLSSSTNHWSVGDSIDGGKGVDTLKIIDNGAIAQINVIPTGSTIKNVEILDIIGGSTVEADTTSIDGVTHLYTTSKAGNKSTAAATTDINVKETDLKSSGTSQLIVNGGKDITVNATGTTTNATVLTPADSTNAEILVGATTAAAGKVTVTNSFASTTDGHISGDVFVKGGTEVIVTQKLTNTDLNKTNVQGAVSVVGNASTKTVTVNQDATVAKSATAVGKTAGAVTIADAKAGSLTDAATISTVTLNNYGISTISSNALSTLNLSGTAGTLGLTTGLTTPANTTLTMNLNKLSGTNTITDSTAATGAGYKTLNINSSTADSTLAALAFADVETLNVSGDAKLTITGNNTLTAVKDIVVTNTAGFDLGTAAIGATVNFTGGAGADAVVLSNAFEKAITMGAGNDKVTYNGPASVVAGKKGSVNAGDGEDTIVMAATDAATASLSSVFNSSFSGFEVLSLTGVGSETIDLDGINGVDKVKTTAAAGLTLKNMDTNGRLTLTAATNIVTVGIKGALLGTTDVLNIDLENDTNALVAFGTVAAANVETININTVDKGTVLNVAATQDTATLNAASATSIVVAGNNGLDLSGSTTTKVTNFDASGVVANDTSDTAANLGVIFTSGNTDATANVTIKGGAGNDELTGNAAIDTITGGAGNDILAGAGGADIINVGEGRDVVALLNANDSTTAAFDSINGFTLATKTASFADQDAFLTGTTGGSNVSILDITTGSATIAVKGNTLTAQAGQHAGVTYTIKDGILTLGGTGASTVDTLGEWLAEAQAALGTTVGDTLAFQFGSDTYVYTENGATDIFVKLVGVTGANALVDGYNNAATVDNTILIG